MDEATAPDFPLDSALQSKLISCYEEMMWLANRPGVTPPMARTWYTHARAEGLKRQLRQFTGKVSVEAVRNPDQPLVLEHYEGIQRRLSTMVAEHVQRGITDSDEFVRLLIECERVHIVTKPENYAAAKALGDYTVAGIELVGWESIDAEARRLLSAKMLRGRVANASAFRDRPTKSASMPKSTHIADDVRILEEACQEYALKRGLACRTIPMSGYREPRIGLTISPSGTLDGVAARLRIRNSGEPSVFALSYLPVAAASKFGNAVPSKDVRMMSGVVFPSSPVDNDVLESFLDMAVSALRAKRGVGQI